MAKKKKEKSFSSFVNNPIDFTLLITILLLLSMFYQQVHLQHYQKVVIVMHFFQSN